MVGIGALLTTIVGLKDSPWYVSVVPEGSTAHIAGLEPGDIVIQVTNLSMFPKSRSLNSSAGRSGVHWWSK